MDASTRRCNKCGQVKPLTREFFYRNNTRRDGFQHKCITCYKAEHPGRPSLRERLMSGIIVNPDTGCWEWQRTKHRGYGNIRKPGTRGGTHGTHRVAYELFVGPIPEGLVLDHLCRNPSCCNPAHLEPVTNAENIMRGVSWGPLNAAKTHCVNGHEFTPENTYVTKRGWRMCRTCAQDRELRYQAAARAIREATPRPTTKRCPDCGGEFPLTGEFWPKKGEGHFKSRCLPCYRAWFNTYRRELKARKEAQA